MQFYKWFLDLESAMKSEVSHVLFTQLPPAFQSVSIALYEFLYWHRLFGRAYENTLLHVHKLFLAYSHNLF